MNKFKVKHMIRQRIIITSLLVVVVVVSFFGGSYSWINSQAVNGEYNYFQNDGFELSYVKDESGYSNFLSIVNQEPLSDKNIYSVAPYKFSITNISGKEKNYKLKINVDQSLVEADGCINKIIPTKYIKYKLDNEQPKLLSEIADQDYRIYFSQESVMPGTSALHELRIWVDEKAPKVVKNMHFHGKVEVETSINSDEYLEYEQGEEVELLSGYKYYVLNDSDKYSSKVTLISKETINKTGVVDKEDMTMLSYSDTLDILYGKYLENMQNKLKNKKTRIDNIEVRLINQEEFYSLSNELKDKLIGCNIWINDFDNQTLNKHYAILDNEVKGKEINDMFALKPVIVIDKENIK